MANGGFAVGDLATRVKNNLTGKLDARSPYLGLVGWWVTVESPDGGEWKPAKIKLPGESEDGVKVKVPMGFLKVGRKDGESAASPKGVPVHFGEPAEVDAYTGDYDLHDVYLGTTAANRRAFVSSPATGVVTATLSRPEGRTETEYDTFAGLLNWSIYRKRGNPPTIFDGYANLVQHGAQNTYFAFIMDLENKERIGRLRLEEKEERVEKLAAWDKDIIFFANDRLVYRFNIENDPIPLQNFHQMYNLANCNNVPKSKMWSANQLVDRFSEKK
jgi:hypothetical protein